MSDVICTCRKKYYIKKVITLNKLYYSILNKTGCVFQKNISSKHEKSILQLLIFSFCTHLQTVGLKNYQIRKVFLIIAYLNNKNFKNL